ncbi:MAG: F-box/WD repeat-containing protein [Verrucomicrobia bacterium]|nr:F-box/WD repeat-containing protein [Verrucomicrobiota bacterium]
MSGFLNKLLPKNFQPNQNLIRDELSLAQLYPKSLSRLPKEVIIELFFRLEPPQITLLARTCRTYHQLSFQNDQFWKLLFSKTFYAPLPNPLLRGSHLEEYKYQHAINMNIKNRTHTEQMLHGHHKGIICLIPLDGMFATGSLDNTIRIWDSKDGKCLKKLIGHESAISCLAAHNEKIISGSFDGIIKIWDLKSEQCLFTITEITHAIRSILIVDGMILSSSIASDINAWDLNTGEHLFTLTGHTDAVAALTFAQGKVISSSYDKTIKAWDLGSRKCVMTLDGHQDAVETLTVFGKKLFSGSQDSTIKVWDLETGECLMTLTGHMKNAIISIQIFNGMILSSCEDFSLKIWDLETGQCITTLSENNRRIDSIAFVDGKLILGSANDPIIKIWNFDSQKILAEIADLFLSSRLEKFEGLHKFSKLPHFIKHQIYKEYSKILPPNKSLSLADLQKAFLKNDPSTFAKKALAIQNYLAKNTPRWLK